MKTLFNICPCLPGLFLLLAPFATVAEPPEENVPVGSRFDSYAAPTETAPAPPPFPQQAEPTGALTLNDAVAAALSSNPALAVFSWEVRAREARAIQAGLFPNPTLSGEFENIGGSGDRAGFAQTETTLGISQRFQLAGQRTKRLRVSEQQTALAEWDYESTRVGILTATTKAFMATLASQSRLSLAAELAHLARATVTSVSAQVDAGAVPFVEKTRAEVVVLTADLERDRAERQLAADRIRLASSWGGRQALFSAVLGDLSGDISPPPALDELKGRIDSNPDIARWRTALAEREAAVVLERARQIPDPTLSLGGRHFNDNGDAALVLNLSLPIPVFDRNQGNTLAAVRQLSKARAEKASAVALAHSALAARYEDLSSAFEQVVALRERALPAAERAFKGTQDGYHQGLFRYLDVLDAQRNLFELRARQIEAQLSFHQARADVERLINGPLYEGESDS